MSLYRLPPTDVVLGIEVVVGWDNSLQTFFAQVEEYGTPGKEPACLLWVGCNLGEVRTVAALHAALHDWAVIAPTLAVQLEADQAAALPPSFAQQILIDALRQ
jgi:hypothetical protein